MTIANDPSDFTPRPPAKRQGPMSPLVWFCLGSGVTCVVLALVVFLGARSLHLGPAPQSAPVEPAAASSASASNEPSVPASTQVANAAAPAPAGLAKGDASALSARLDRVESEHHALVEAASAALAAASLSQASDTGRPFVTDLDALSRVLPDSHQVDALRALAEHGAPPRAVLVAEFPDMARRAAYASRAPVEGSGWLAQAAHAVGVLFTVRRTDQLSGSGPDAVLARAEHRLNDGDLDGAVHELDSLPPKGREAAAPWRDRATRRMQIQNRVAAIRLEALKGLASASKGTGQ